MRHTLNIGPVRLAWNLDENDPTWEEFLAAYALYLDHEGGQFEIEASVTKPGAGDQRPRLPNSFIRARRIQGREFDLGPGLVTGNLNGDHSCHCRIHPILLHSYGLRVLEQFFYMLFYHVTLASASEVSRAPFLLHSAGVLSEDNVVLFCGPPGSGKSTAAALCPARPLLSDEAVVCQPGTQEVTVSGSPINPFCQDKEIASGPLASLYLLEHGKQHSVSDLSRDEAIPKLTAEVVVPLGLLETDLKEGMVRALDRALILYETGRVRCLRFRPDPGFWNLVA